MRIIKAWFKSGAGLIAYIPERPFMPELVVYQTREGEIATGFSNHYYITEHKEAWRLFIDIDNKTMNLDEILNTIGRKYPIFLAAETARGYHVITSNVYFNKERLLKEYEWLADKRIIDEGMLTLCKARMGHDPPFTNILRFNGKYERNDIVVKRWLPPLDPWEQNILNIYRQHTTFELSASRILHGCTAWTTVIDEQRKKAMEHGKRQHEIWQMMMKHLDFETEKEIKTTINGVVVRGFIDAYAFFDNKHYIVEYKSSPKLLEYGLEQAKIYAGIIAHSNTEHDFMLTAESQLVIITHSMPNKEALENLKRKVENALALRNRVCSTCALKQCKMRLQQ